jgi:hypothetical protein
VAVITVFVLLNLIHNCPPPSRLHRIFLFLDSLVFFDLGYGKRYASPSFIHVTISRCTFRFVSVLHTRGQSQLAVKELLGFSLCKLLP